MPFTAIVFNRSLHHLQPVSAAVHRAYELTQLGARIIVEDFAFGEAGDHTIHWFRAQIAELHEAKLLDTSCDGFALRILDSRDPLHTWHSSAHDLASPRQIDSAINRWFVQVRTVEVPYLFRYAEQVLLPCERRRVTNGFLKNESAAIRARRIQPVGRRWIARRR